MKLITTFFKQTINITCPLISLVQNGLQLFKWGHFHIFSLSYNLTLGDLWPWYMTCDCMNIWRFSYNTNKPSWVPIGLKLFKWGHFNQLQLFKWGHFHIFSLSYNLTSDNLWHWYVTFNLINKWGFPCCICDPTLVEIHQSVWKLEPNVNSFSQQQTTTDNNNNSGHSDPYLSFLLRQVTHTIKKTKTKTKIKTKREKGKRKKQVYCNPTTWFNKICLSQ